MRFFTELKQAAEAMGGHVQVVAPAPGRRREGEPYGVEVRASNAGGEFILIGVTPEFEDIDATARRLMPALMALGSLELEDPDDHPGDKRLAVSVCGDCGATFMWEAATPDGVVEHCPSCAKYGSKTAAGPSGEEISQVQVAILEIAAECRGPEADRPAHGEIADALCASLATLGFSEELAATLVEKAKQ